MNLKLFVSTGSLYLRKFREKEVPIFIPVQYVAVILVCMISNSNSICIFFNALFVVSCSLLTFSQLKKKVLV